MSKTDSERSRDYRQRKNANKIKKIAKSSTERVRQFRARRKMLLTKVNDNAAGVSNRYLKREGRQEIHRTHPPGLTKVDDTKRQIALSTVKSEESSPQQLEHFPLLLNEQIKEEEEIILDNDGPPSPWDYYAIQEQHSPLVLNEPLNLEDEEILESKPCAYADCNQTEFQKEPSPLEQKAKHHCKECDRNFNSYNAVKYHQRKHSDQRSHKCETCERSFFTQSALNVHKKKHSDVKPFKCSHCDHRCRQLGHLQSHILSRHSEVKAFSCEFCGKNFARRYSLLLHRRIHTSERNYACEYCNKTFRASSYLLSHTKVHTGERPYKCSICGKAFGILGNLKRHLRIHEPAERTQSKMKHIKEKYDIIETYNNFSDNEAEQEVLGL